MKRNILTMVLFFLTISAFAGRPIPPSDVAPEDWTRIPYCERRPEFVPTEAEKTRGFALFTRPITDPVYPESRPGAEERTTELSGFAAGDQWLTLNFAVYPLRELKNLRVVAGEFACGEHLLRDVQVRLVTYRDVRYTHYNSKTKQYRVLPEYLQPVTECDAPEKVSQRYFLTFYVPKGCPAGKYTGRVTVTYDGLSKAATLPVTLEVLPFDLLKDPTKHYSAYYYAPFRHTLVQTGQKDEAWAREVMRKEFRVMRDYGFDRSPVMCMGYDLEEKKFFIPNFDFWQELMKENGMEPPIPTIGGSVSWVLTKYCDVKFGSHLVMTGTPTEEAYAEIEKLCRAWKKECDAKGYPAMVFGPLDEISPQSTEFGVRIYKIFHDAGLPTYTTKEPMDPSFMAYDPVVDIFASQVFLPPYDEVMTKHKKEYWCYPNHNSYERKDMVIMCHGGRQTYGFGFWRSGFDMLVPWIWRNNSPDHFNLASSGGANILNPETGDMIMTTYWECFREGIHDLKYLYTLQTAIVQREEATDPAVQALCQSGRALLQEIWDSIVVQEKYLSGDLIPSEKFDVYRRAMAEVTQSLLKYPATNEKVAPSVIVEPRNVEHPDSFEVQYQEKLKAGKLRLIPVDLTKCRATEKEATVEVVPGKDGKPNAMLRVQVDTQNDGTGNPSGNYLSGWPALVYNFPAGTFDRVPKGIRIRYRVTSSRTDCEKFPLTVGVRPVTSFTITGKPMGDAVQEVVHTLSDNNRYDGLATSDAVPAHLRLTVSENHYQNSDDVRFLFEEISLIDWDEQE
ncbi:MAG: hypothetical protein Q4D98_00960 [Planctomycetia bacterium]|nr:hypothetical protein [Planctomycetia bacterium]